MGRGLSPLQKEILTKVAQTGRVTSAQVCGSLPSASRALTRLWKRGLLDREWRRGERGTAYFMQWVYTLRPGLNR
jgi:hypothetical protein